MHNELAICVTLTTFTGQIYLVDTIDTPEEPHTVIFYIL